MALGGVSRTISFALALSSANFNAGLNSAGANLNNFASASEKHLHRVAAAAGAAGAALGAGFALAATRAMDFETEMSNVAAVSGATGAELEALRQSAIDLGASSIFTAKEAAQAVTELSKAGVGSADILGGALEGALSLAAAANIDLAQAAEITATTLNNFGLYGRDASHVADVLAAAANKSAADVNDMALALKQVGAVADMTGMDFEETTSALTVFANAGVKGSDAGTSLKTMLLRLNPQTEKASKEMKKWGLEMVDSEGNFKSMAEVAGELEEGFAGVSDAERSAAMQTIFGQDAIRASTLLYEAGADGVARWEEEVNESGYAAEVARIKMDNLSGDVERLGGAIDSVLIQAGSEANGALRSLVQTATAAVDQIGDLPPVVGQLGMGVSGIGALALGAVSGLGMFIPMARNTKGALDAMGGAWSTVAGKMTMSNFMGIAAGAAVAAGAFMIFASQVQGAKQRAEEANAIFMAKLTPPSDLQTHVTYVDAITAEHNRLVDELHANYDRDLFGLDTTGSVGMGLERAYEALNPFGSDDFSEIEERIKSLRDTHGEAVGQGMAYAETLSRVADEMGLTSREVEELAAAQGVDLVGSVNASIAGLDGYEQSWTDVNGRVELTDAALSSVTGNVEDNLGPALAAAHEDANRAAAGAIALEDALTATGDEASTAADRLDAFRDSVELTIGSMRDSDAAKRDSVRALWEMEEAAKAVNEENWHGFDRASEAAFTYQDSIDDLLRAYGEEIVLARERGASQAEMNAIYTDTIGRIENLGAQGVISAGEVESLRGQLESIPRHTDTYIATHTQDAHNRVSAILGHLGQLAGQTFSFGIRGVSAGIAGALGFADGGIIGPNVRYFADGGHHPQIARPGSMTRVWNEPEAGGESYIPWAQSKRSGALEVLSATANAFGYALLPADEGARSSVAGALLADLTAAASDPRITAALVAGAADDTITATLAASASDPRIGDALVTMATAAIASATPGVGGGSDLPGIGSYTHIGGDGAPIVPVSIEEALANGWGVSPNGSISSSESVAHVIAGSRAHQMLTTYGSARNVPTGEMFWGSAYYNHMKTSSPTSRPSRVTSWTPGATEMPFDGPLGAGRPTQGAPIASSAPSVIQAPITVHASAPNYVGDRRELEDWLSDTLRRDGAIQDHVSNAVYRAQSARDGTR